MDNTEPASQQPQKEVQPPDTEKILVETVFRRFGKKGIFVIAIIVALWWVWTQRQNIMALPGVSVTV
ncbi:MAG: hypothetical protein HZA01_04000 [Nitrospinae bacterium]|nr:hypothetical protein [Nitrospinota bacterium]